MAGDGPISIWEGPRLFREIALRHFAFLVQELGFTVVDDSATPFIAFASPTDEVRVYYNPEWHHELDVVIRDRGAPPGSGSGVDILLKAAGLPHEAADDVAIKMPSTVHELDEAIARRAAQVRQLLRHRSTDMQ